MLSQTISHVLMPVDNLKLVNSNKALIQMQQIVAYISHHFTKSPFTSIKNTTHSYISLVYRVFF